MYQHDDPELERELEQYYDAATRSWIPPETDFDRFARFLAEWSARNGEPSDLDALMALAAETPDETLHYVGICPLEDLLHASGDEIVDAFVASMEASPRLREAAFEIYLSRGHFSPAAEERIAAEIGRGFEFLPGGEDASASGA